MAGPDRARLVEQVLDVLEAEKLDRSEFEQVLEAFVASVEEARETRLEAAYRSWKTSAGALTKEEYRDKHALSPDLFEAAVEAGLIASLEPPLPSYARKHYRDEVVPKHVLTELREKLDEETYLVTRKAAALLGVSAAKFKALAQSGKISEAVPEWNVKGDYPGTYYRLADLKALKRTLTAKPPGAKQKERWGELNERQRRYLELLYQIEKGREGYYTSREAMFSESKKGGEWRWIRHHSAGFSSGFDMTLEREGLLDQGTGATFEALAKRGYIERRWGHSAVNDDGYEYQPLEVRLTRTGRKLVKDMA